MRAFRFFPHPSANLGRCSQSRFGSRVFRCIVFSGMALTFNATVLSSAPQKKQPPANFSAFLDEHCANCHDSETKKGDLDLSALSFELSDASEFQRWENIFDRVADLEMPPKKKPQPDGAERQIFLAALKKELQATDVAREKAVGRVQARRLTRSEFEKTLQHLLGIDLPFESRLPEDPFTDGFNTVAKGQQISSNQLAIYLSAIDEALDAAFAQALSPKSEWQKRLSWEELQRKIPANPNLARGPEGRPGHQDVVAWNVRNQEFYGRMEATKVPVDGWYKIRVRARGVELAQGERISASIFAGKHVSTAPERHLVGAIEADEYPADFEFVSWMKAGELLRAQVCDGSLAKKRAPLHPQTREAMADLDGQGFSGIAIQSIDLERVYPRFDPDQTRRLLFGDSAPGMGDPVPPSNPTPKPQKPSADLERQVLAFARRAFRRPVTPEEIAGHTALGRARMEAGASFVVGLRTAYRSVLMSPRFLYLEEKPGPLNAHALATRLSFFLWGSPPDTELRGLADSGKLLEPTILKAQVERMLADEKVQQFVRSFTDQWLKLRDIDATTPDEKLYGEYDDLLKDAMLAETRAFFSDLLQRDLSIGNIVDSNHTFLNNRLAKHYGIPPLPNAGLQRVALKPEFHRGGLLTQASILKVTANGTTTSPVVRGVWVLEKITGTRVPPPPASVPAIEPDIRGAKTIREQLQKHQAQESCAACHLKIDPPGFALENYDVIGGWRQNYRAVNEKGWKVQGLKVDASYHDPDGHGFNDLNELKQELLKTPERLAENLVHHFITYSTGAPPSFSDREAIEAIVADAASRNYGVRTLIHALIQSPVFKNK
jgi:hypothetical protein